MTLLNLILICVIIFRELFDKMSKSELTPEEMEAKEQEEFNTGPLR